MTELIARIVLVHHEGAAPPLFNVALCRLQTSIVWLCFPYTIVLFIHEEEVFDILFVY